MDKEQERKQPGTVEIHYSHRTREDFDREAAKPVVFERRSLVYGLIIFGALVALAVAWRLSHEAATLRKPSEFEFTVEPEEPDRFELTHPQRDILQEKPEDMPDIVEQEERPHIHVTTVPIDELVTREVIRTPNVEIDTSEIDVRATEIEIEDRPEEITEESPLVTRALQPIAADLPDYGEIYKYREPSPRDLPLLHVINRAPAPGRALRVLPKQFGEQDAPAMGELGPANVNLFGTGDFFRTMTQFGGIKAKAAVDAALQWLAVHQEPEGHWSARKYEGGDDADMGVSGLALLAFMGGGHTTRRGEYRRNVLRGLEALLRNQGEDGNILKGGRMYAHAIATIALCEAYGRARDERIGLAARKAVAFLEKAANADGGWRYTPNCGASDISVTAWCIQALKTARLAQIKFDNAIFSRALLFVDSVTDRGGTAESNGAVGYMFQPEQIYGSGHPALTAAGMMVRQFSGVGVKNHLLVKGAELTRNVPPNWGNKDFYYWYYATYAMHNMGGEHRIWWNRRIRDVLIENQVKAGEHAGSWDPKGCRWGDRGGRVYTTALGALCLEVYYRYSDALNSFGVAPDIDDLFLQ